jgi:SAM-dependent methyltransferase
VIKQGSSITWPDFLAELISRYPSTLAFAYQWWEYNAPQARLIQKIVPPPARILEVGTGTGANAIFLDAHGYDVLGVDNDPQVLASAERLADYFHASCRFAQADGFDLRAYYGQFDLVFSSGVVEHFGHDDAVRLLREQGKVGRNVLVTIPTWHALRHDPLTEASHARNVRPSELKQMCCEAGLEVVRSFAFGTPSDTFSKFYAYLLPKAIQWFVQTKFSYACTVGCFCRPDTVALNR